MRAEERAVRGDPAGRDLVLRQHGERHAHEGRLTLDVRRGVEFLLDGVDVDPVDGHTGQSDDFPLTTLLGSLVAIISLIGGVAMAFYTSWRLSMLAFTTVGPIVHVTQAYAQWSRDQNRRILAHLGEANAAATEALANVRTVKAAGDRRPRGRNAMRTTPWRLEIGASSTPASTR